MTDIRVDIYGKFIRPIVIVLNGRSSITIGKTIRFLLCEEQGPYEYHTLQKRKIGIKGRCTLMGPWNRLKAKKLQHPCYWDR